MKTSPLGLAFIQRNEWVPRSARCGWNEAKQLYFPYKDYKGFPTMGCGHLIRPTDNFSQGLTEAQVVGLLASDLASVEKAINENIKVSLTQNRFDALADFGFNLGVGALRQEKNTFIRLLNIGRYDDVARIDPQGKVEGLILEWCHVGKDFDKGLYNRRMAEAHLWTMPYPVDHEEVEVQEAYLAPLIDLTAGIFDDLGPHASPFRNDQDELEVVMKRDTIPAPPDPDDEVS